MRILFIVFILFSAAVADADERRIVSLAASTTEILFAVDAGSHILAVDNFSRYPSTAASLPKVGDYRGFSLEVIASYKPTHLVLVENYISATDLAPLRKLGAEIVTCPNGAFAGLTATTQCIETLAKKFGNPQKGRRLARAIEVSAKQAAETAAGRKSSVLIILDTKPLYAVGKRNFIHEIFTTAGFKNVMADAPLTYPQVSQEAILAVHPDHVVTFRESFAEDLRTLYRRVPGARRPPIHVLDEDVFSRPGPRIAEAFAALRRIRSASTPESP